MGMRAANLINLPENYVMKVSPNPCPLFPPVSIYPSLSLYKPTLLSKFCTYDEIGRAHV